MGRKVTFFFLFCATWAWGQGDQAEVLKLLRSNQVQLSKTPMEELAADRWEALAYWDTDTLAGSNELEEAVPDWYQFYRDDTFDLLLVDPRNAGQARQVVSGRFFLDNNQLKIIPLNKNEVVDQWTIYYLDAHYLVMEIDGLRVLFIHPSKE